MSAPIIVNIRNFDVNKLSFTVGPKKPQRMPTINMKYDGQPFNIRFPAKMSGRMFARTDNNTKKTSYTLLTNLKGCDPLGQERSTGGTDVDALYNLVLFDLKDKILKTATEKSKEWFNKVRTADIIQESFKDMYRLSGEKDADDNFIPNGKYAPSMTIKIPVYEDNVATDFIDENGEPIKGVFPHTLEKIFPPKANVEVNMVVAPSIYIMAGSAAGTGGAFGVTWRLNYAKVFKPTKLSASSVFAEEPEEEAQEEKSNTQIVDEERPTTPVAEPEVQQTSVPSAPARKKRSAANV
jgi:hypothetical protein